MPRNSFCARLQASACAVIVLAICGFTGLPITAGAQTSPAATPPATAQQPVVQATPQNGQASGDDTAQFTIKRSVDEVDLIFTVRDKRSGRFIKDLKQDDFALLDDQKAPAKVYKFVQQTNLPLRVGIVIDASTSIRQRFQFEQQSATQFLGQVLRPKSDKAFIMGFDVLPEVKQDWTSNLDQLETGIDRLRPGGGTALFDAVYTACKDKLLTNSRGQEPVRKAMILISDGDDNQSRAFLDDSIKMCQRAETIIFSISTNVSPSRGRGDAVLQKMSAATGGSAYFPKRIEDMPQSFQEIEDELRSQYALSYTPADFKTDGSFRTIYLFANDRRYDVQAKKGYFAPKE